MSTKIQMLISSISMESVFPVQRVLCGYSGTK